MSRNYIRGEEEPTWWRPIIHFVGHTLAGTLIFVIIGLPAVGLDFLVKAFKAGGASGYTIEVLELLEKAVLTIDACLYLLYLGVTAIVAAKGIIAGLRR